MAGYKILEQLNVKHVEDNERDCVEEFCYLGDVICVRVSANVVLIIEVDRESLWKCCLFEVI